MKLPSCNPHVLNLIAFLAVLGAIVALAMGASRDMAIITGLVGVLGSFRPWSTSIASGEPTDVRVANKPGDPAIVKEAEG